MSEFTPDDQSVLSATLAVADACVMTSEFEYCDEDFMTYSSRYSSTNEISLLVKAPVECGSDVSDDTSMVACLSEDQSPSFTFNSDLTNFQGASKTFNFYFSCCF